MNQSSPLANQVALITGASSGIGAAVAKSLHAAGMQLVLTGRRVEQLEEVARSANNAALLPGDITDPALPDRLIALALERFGRCDVVFNNAGVIDVAPIEETDVDRVCRMVRVNVEAAFRLAYVALKHFKKQNTGHLLNTSSILGTKVRPNAGAYAGTKYAIEALSEALRMELAGTPIRVSCIEPGLVLTGLHRDWKVHPTKALNIPNPLRPDDIARAVRFILEQPPHVSVPRLMMLPSEQAL